MSYLDIIFELNYFLGPHRESDERKYHAYYQWVPIVLSIQAVMFYAPHWIWKQLEGGRMLVCAVPFLTFSSRF
jgi:hypothetical protein